MIYDVAVIGAGPAGLSAALNSVLEGFSTVLIERDAIGGRAATSARIDNVLGHAPGELTGPLLASRGLAQCVARGVEIEKGDVFRLSPDGSIIHTSSKMLKAKATILATGIQWRDLTKEVEGLASALALGSARYGCVVEDGPKAAGKRIAVLGGANSAGINALHFAASGAREVFMLVRSSFDGMSAYLQKEILAESKIIPLIGSRLEAVMQVGTDLHLDFASGGLSVEKLFLFPDAEPQVSFAPCEKDGKGFVVAPHFATSIPALFAAGDIRSGSTKRIATAIGEGAATIFKVKSYLSELSQRCSVCVA